MDSASLFHAASSEDVGHVSAKIAAAKIDEGRDPNGLDERGTSVLSSAVQSRDIRLVQLVLAAGVDVDRVDADGENLLLYAVRKNDIDAVRILVAANANVNVVKGRAMAYGLDDTPLIRSLVPGHAVRSYMEIARMLISAGATVAENQRITLLDTIIIGEPVVTIREVFGLLHVKRDELDELLEWFHTEAYGPVDEALEDMKDEYNLLVELGASRRSLSAR